MIGMVLNLAIQEIFFNDACVFIIFAVTYISEIVVTR